MNTRPLPIIGDEYDGNPIIEEAVRSIWAFEVPGAEHLVTREQARGVIEWWQHFHELSGDEVEAILRRFPTGAEIERHGNSGPGGEL